jgi:LysM repeat protein
MKTKNLILFAFLLGILFVVRPVHSAPLATSPNALIAAVNAVRAANGLHALTANSILMSVAQGHANYMAATGNVSHYGADGSRPFQRSLAAGYPVAGDLTQGGFHAENILSGSMDASGAVAAWLTSAPHTNTMLSPNFLDVGAGVANVGGRYYYVLVASRQSGGAVAYTPPVSSSGAPVGAPGVNEYIIPVTRSTPEANGAIIHEVQSGQSFWAIAIAYETTIAEIMRLNGLSQNATLYPGNKLMIRPAQADSPPPPTATPDFILPPIDSPALALEPVFTPLSPPTPIPAAAQIATETPEPAAAFDANSAWIPAVIVALSVLVAVLAMAFSGRREI